MKAPTTDIGRVAWTDHDLRSALQDFMAVYQGRPIADNRGGMGPVQSFYLWFLLQRLQPAYVVESGVWRGQSTWIIEQAAPQAQIFAIDPNLKRIVYRSADAIYLERDFSLLDWTAVDPERTVLFFDDHQDAIPRLQQAKGFGFRHVSFEDNYPPGRGDCHSLKQALMGVQANLSNASWLQPRKWFKQHLIGTGSVLPHTSCQHDDSFIRRNIDLYYEFPPIFRSSNTRWGDAWTDERYPTKSALVGSLQSADKQLFHLDAGGYNWFAYVRLKD